MYAILTNTIYVISHSLPVRNLIYFEPLQYFLRKVLFRFFHQIYLLFQSEIQFNLFREHTRLDQRSLKFRSSFLLANSPGAIQPYNFLEQLPNGKGKTFSKLPTFGVNTNCFCTFPYIFWARHEIMSLTGSRQTNSLT